MLGNYLNTLHQLKWKFDKNRKKEFEKMLNVQFKKMDDGYVIDDFRGNIFELLMRLQIFDFTITKKDNDYQIQLKL